MADTTTKEERKEERRAERREERSIAARTGTVEKPMTKEEAQRQMDNPPPPTPTTQEVQEFLGVESDDDRSLDERLGSGPRVKPEDNEKMLNDPPRPSPTPEEVAKYLGESDDKRPIHERLGIEHPDDLRGWSKQEEQDRMENNPPTPQPTPEEMQASVNARSARHHRRVEARTEEAAPMKARAIHAETQKEDYKTRDLGGARPGRGPAQ